MIKQPEAFAAHRIEAQLLNLNWRIADSDRNVYLQGECKTPEQKIRLKGKKPDYILYKSDSIHPIAIIEAKKPGKNLEHAKKQAIGYAKSLGVKLVFVSDSFVTHLYDVNGNMPTIDSESVGKFLPEELLVKLENKSDLTTDKKIVKNRDDLIKLFKKAEKQLRKDGLDVGMDSIYEFCTILFIKIMSETDSKIRSHYRWEKLTELSGEELLEHYKNTINEFKGIYKGIFREMHIRNPVVLEKIISDFKDINLSDTEMDVKGEAYEHFLKRYSRQNKSVLGQNFTPRHIANMMALLLNPQIEEGETIYDPFCGTGGMLLECYKEIKRNIHGNKEALKKLNQKTLFGSDISEGTSQIAKMNMVLVGDGHSNIKRRDSLENRVNGEYDCLITNIPFNLDASDTGHLYGVSTRNSNEICVRHCLDAVKDGGRACIIVPENLAYDLEYKSLRKYILKNCKIEACIRLPRHTFRAYATARTCILWLTGIRKKSTKNFPYIEIENDGYTDSAWLEPIDGSEIPNIVENKHNLASHYKNQTLGANLEFIVEASDIDYTNTEGKYRLADLVEVKTEKQEIESQKTYYEPRISAQDNTMKGKERLGKNVKAGKKIFIEPGDLVIGTLHTQSKNGMFAISDSHYIAASQLVCRIKTHMISKEYLCVALQNILPKLKKNDLTGRETYSKKEILELPIPKEPKSFKADMEQIRKLEKDKEKIEDEIAKIKSKYKN